jgi:hypothetical protein
MPQYLSLEGIATISQKKLPAPTQAQREDGMSNLAANQGTASATNPKTHDRKNVMRKEELIEYWKRSSDENYFSMMNMFASKEYTWSLFVGHLCIEKLLKALYVKHVDINTPRTHNLYKIACTLGYRHY